MKIQITNHGTIWSFRPLDKKAAKKLRSIGASAWQFMGDTLCVDHRPAQQLVEQLADEGVEFVN